MIKQFSSPGPLALALLAAVAGCARRPPDIGGRAIVPATPATYAAVPADAPRGSSAHAIAMPDLQSLTLARVVDLALQNNPATRQSWASAIAAADDYGASRGELMPSLSAGVSASRSLSLGTLTRPSEERTQYGPTATLSYLVLDFGGRSGRIDYARRTALATSLTHNVTVQNTILATESAVYGYLGTRALRDAQLAAVKEAEANLKAAQERHEVGLATIADELQAKTALAQARLDLETVEGDLAITRSSVAVAMGLPATTEFDIPTIAPLDSAAMMTVAVDSLISIAEQSRPDLAAAREIALSAGAAARVARSANRPALALSSTGGLTGSSVSGSSGGNYSLNIGLQMPVFTGFANEYRARAADADVLAAQARSEVVRQQVALQVVTAHTGLQTAARRMSTAQELLEAALQSEQVAAGRYREGVGTIVDLLVAQSALASARAQAIQTQWQWRQALAQLSHDVGTLGIHGEPFLSRDTTSRK
jgi:outer membrane protein TolC